MNSSSSKQDREEAAVMMQTFRGVWDSYYDNQETAAIMRLCELLHSKSGGKAYANIFNLVEVVQRIPTAGFLRKSLLTTVKIWQRRKRNTATAARTEQGAKL